MLDAALSRIQKAMVDREVEARRAGNAAAAKVWASACELVQEEKRRAFGAPAVTEKRGAA